jgi:hypothetical protein
MLWLFAAMSLSDLVLTWFLLNRNGGGAYESNPVAAWWLEQFGWPGLIAFKLLVSVVAVLAVILIARRSLLAAGSILSVACAALLGVLVYSSLLVPEVCAQSRSEEEVSSHIEQLEGHRLRFWAYHALLNRLASELMDERRSLDTAVNALLEDEHVHEPVWFESLSYRFPAYTLRELVAIRLMLEVREIPNVSPDQMANRIIALSAQFQDRFHRPVPAEFDDMQKSI